MKHSLRVIGLATAISVMSAILPQRQRKRSLRNRRRHRLRRPNQKRTPARRPRVRQRVLQSEPLPVGAPPRARSSEQAIAVARIGEPSERTSDTKGTGVRYLYQVCRSVEAHARISTLIRCRSTMGCAHSGLVRNLIGGRTEDFRTGFVISCALAKWRPDTNHATNPSDANFSRSCWPRRACTNVTRVKTSLYFRTESGTNLSRRTIPGTRQGLHTFPHRQ